MTTMAPESETGGGQPDPAATPVAAAQAAPGPLLAGRRIVITGGTGSLGRALVRRVLSGTLGTPERVVVMSRDEGRQHAMRLAYQRRPRGGAEEILHGNARRALDLRIGDVRDHADVCAALHGADVVVNAAALKQVPACEYLPDQAVATNCQGAVNIVRALREHDWPVEAVIGVSSDKACKPVNVMGMTKAIQERILLAANLLDRATRFVVVRFGNVLGAHGSVVPLFRQQIAAGGPVTLTAPEMTRFLLTTAQAVDAVVAALAHALPGEVLVPVTPSATMGDLARALIGGRDVAVQVTGARPGEKLHETLISAEEAATTVRRGPGGAYYAVRSLLPELRPDTDADAGDEPPALRGEYSSAGHVAGPAEVAALLGAAGLLPGQAPAAAYGDADDPGGALGLLP